MQWNFFPPSLRLENFVSILSLFSLSIHVKRLSSSVTSGVTQAASDTRHSGTILLSNMESGREVGLGGGKV